MTNPGFNNKVFNDMVTALNTARDGFTKMSESLPEHLAAIKELSGKEHELLKEGLQRVDKIKADIEKDLKGLDSYLKTGAK